MFMASYDWSMWLRDTPFGKAFEIARQRGFEPPCKRMRRMVFWKKYAIKVRPFFDFKLSELRWHPYGKDHKDDHAYKKPGKNAKAKLQVVRRIAIMDIPLFAYAVCRNNPAIDETRLDPERGVRHYRAGEKEVRRLSFGADGQR
jgi:hypothetical protein